jgi:DUF1016 N-terminal domain
MTASYWEIGRRIVGAEHKSRSDVYGKQLIQQLSIDLTQQFGRGFGVVNLSQMRAFYQLWPTEKIFQTLSEKSFLLPLLGDASISRAVSRKLTPTPTLPELAKAFPLPWSAYVVMLSVKNPQARAF